MNNKGKKDAIRRRVEALPIDSAFTATDFADIADSASTRRALKEMTDSGTIARAARGVYYKPKYNVVLKMRVPPNVDSVAVAIARARGWTIVPSGNHALNMLGLDTQVPAVYSYVSTGPYTTIRMGSLIVEFRHSASKDLAGMSYTTLLVVQALKALKKERVDDKVIEQLSQRLSSGEKYALLEETPRVTDWIRRALCKIAGGRER